jgi:hypothetical protein
VTRALGNLAVESQSLAVEAPALTKLSAASGQIFNSKFQNYPKILKISQKFERPTLAAFLVLRWQTLLGIVTLLFRSLDVFFSLKIPQTKPNKTKH